MRRFLYQWYKRAGDYDSYLDKQRQAERRRMIAERNEQHKQITSKMLKTISKKLDTMPPEELKHANIPDWVKTSIETERDVFRIRKEDKGDNQGQIEITFNSAFEGM